MKRITLFIFFSFIFGCSTIDLDGSFKEEDKKEVKKREEENKPFIQFKNPFTDDITIEDILGR